MNINTLHVSNQFLRLILYIVLFFISFILLVPKQEKKRCRSDSVYSETTYEDVNLDTPLFNTNI